MTDTESARLREAAVRAKTTPETEHVEFQFRDGETFLCCVRCMGIKPRNGWTRPCRKVRIELRGGSR